MGQSFVLSQVMPNDALRQALLQAKMTEGQLAAALTVSPKSVGRWISGSHVPQARTRWRISETLGVPEMALFPQVAQTIKTGADREIIKTYDSHSAVPDKVWRSLIDDAESEIMLCGYAPYWLAFKVPHLLDALRDKVTSGCRVRILIGDPESPLVVADERATGGSLPLSARVAETLHLFEPLRDVVQVRQSALGFGRSVYLGDQRAVIDWWLHGRPGMSFPVWHLQRRQTDGPFDGVRSHAEALWEDPDTVSAWPQVS
jgi:transcriptional regulator with XRE-family HTH domain